MPSTVILALQITAIGMLLIFAALTLLWGVMALLVRIVHSPSTSKESEISEETGRKYRAAAVAVAIALAQLSEAEEPHPFPLPPTALVSAWQAVNRARMLNKRGTVR